MMMARGVLVGTDALAGGKTHSKAPCYIPSVSLSVSWR